MLEQKKPKIRFYGGSESSDFRTAASVAQANERYSYLTLVCDRLKHTTCIPQLDKFVTIKDRQFSKAKLRRDAVKYKRPRKSLKEIRKRTTKIKESIEGTTYESGVGADQTAKKIMEIIYHPSPHVNKAIERMKEKRPRYRNDKVSSTDGKCKNRDIRLAFYDLETGGFRKDADLLQVCFHCDGVDDLDLYIMPEKGIEPSATKVHGLSVSYSTGEKRLVNCKGELKNTVTAKYAASKIVAFVKQVMSGDTPVILVAHNGNSFDHDRLLSFLERNHELHELSKKLSRDFILWR